MSIFAISLILFVGQLNTLQPKPIVHLQPHNDSIKVAFNGCVLELINAPKVIHLPVRPPKTDARGIPWSIEVKNAGPSPVAVIGEKTTFKTTVSVGQTIQIDSNGSEYLLIR